MHELWSLDTTNCGKFFKRWVYQTTLPGSWEICMQVKKQQLELYMEQQTGFKLGKEYIKAVYCHPAYLTYMQSTSCKMLGWMKHKLESRLQGEISVQFSSITQSCLTLSDPMDCSTPGFPVHHQLPELTQTHVHRVSEAIQPSQPLSSPSPSTFNPSQHQGLFQWVSSSHQVAKVLESDIICVSEVVDISPGNLNSSLCFIQPSILHDILCIEVK